MAEDSILPPLAAPQANPEIKSGSPPWRIAANKRKADLLGMPFGTAMGRLRKAIMFDLLSRLDLNKCHRCGEPMCIDDVSIEHVDAWQVSGDPRAAFFDVENISFSHYTCNVSAASKPNKVHADKREHGRVNSQRYYARHSERWNETRNARRRAASAARRQDSDQPVLKIF